jgi:hypothetical protein
MTDRSDGGDGEVRLEMAMVIPGKGRHTIAALDAGSQQRARKSPHAAFQSGPVAMKERSVAAPRNHRRVGVINRGVDEGIRNKERPLLDQPHQGSFFDNSIHG